LSRAVSPAESFEFGSGFINAQAFERFRQAAFNHFHCPMLVERGAAQSDVLGCASGDPGAADDIPRRRGGVFKFLSLRFSLRERCN